jgi:SAM-dependent methyltransferase
MATYDFFAGRRTTTLGHFLGGVLTRRFLREIRRNCPGAKDIVEIGTGHGGLAGVLRSEGYGYVGYEPRERLATMAVEAGFTMRNALVPPLLEGDSSCDVILMSHVFEHMGSIGQAQEFLSEARRCLRPGGTLILLSPDLLDFGADFWNIDYTHAFPTTLHRVKQMLNDSELEPVRSTFVYGSLPYFPGYFLNLGMKAFRFVFHPILELAYPRMPRLYTIRTTFSRSFLVLARKPL